MIKKQVIFCVLSFLLTTTVYAQAPNEPLTIAFKPLTSGNQTLMQLAAPQAYAFNSQDTFNQFWKQLDVTGSAAPTVDFTKNMVIAVVDKNESSGGYTLKITDVTLFDNALEVDIKRELPAPDCMVSAILTQPFDIVIIPSTAAQKVSLSINTKVVSCGS